MLSIGTKKYRNLQEQVGYNTECIKKLDDYLDGITIEDKLVVIESDSGTFTDEELVILSGPLAFISDGKQVWIKQNETLTQLNFKAIEIVATEVGSAYFNLGLSQIVIDRETGAYNTSADTFFTTYNKSQLDSIVANIMAVKADASNVYTRTETNNLLADKANLSGANFTGNVEAETLKQRSANYVKNITVGGTNSTFSALTYEQIYNRFQVINSRLTMIFNFKVTNNTGATVTLSGNVFSSAISNIPAEIGAKIVDLKGDPITETAQNSYVLITSAEVALTDSITNVLTVLKPMTLFLDHRNSEDNAIYVYIQFQGSTTHSLADGASVYVTGRIWLDLI